METHTTPPVTLEGLSLDALAGLQEQVEAEIQRKHKARQLRALIEIARLVTEAELSTEVVMDHLEGKRKPGRGGSKASKLPPKFRDPGDPENTWAGRGKRPKWLEAKLAAGATLEDFRIGMPAAAARKSPEPSALSHRDGKQAGDNLRRLDHAPSTTG